VTRREFDAYVQRYARETIPLYDFVWAGQAFAETLERARALR
jgi:hypothetical protein